MIQARFRNLITLVPVFLVTAVFSQQSAWAYLVSPFDASQLLKRSDVLCKLTITSITQKGLYPDTPHFKSTPKCLNMIATANVLSVINGPASVTIKISYPGEKPQPKNIPSFCAPLPQFKIGQTYSVALIGKSQPYQLANISSCAIVLPPDKVKYTYGTSPTDKLFAELMHAVSSKDEAIRQQAVRQLAYLGDNRAAKIFRDMADSKDLSIKATGLIGGMNVGVTPSQQDLLAYLKMNPAKKVPTYKPMNWFGEKSIAQIQDDILSALCLSVSLQHTNLLKGFDYTGFIAKTLRCKPIQDNATLRDHLADTVRRLKSCGCVSANQCHRLLKSIARLGPTGGIPF